MNITAELELLLTELGNAGAEFAVCGGIAVTLLAAPRMTKDIDLLVPRVSLDLVRQVAIARGFTFEAVPMTFDRGTHRERTLHRLTKTEGRSTLTLDLILTEPSFGDVWNSRIAVEWKGRRVPVVSREGLAMMKRTANRIQDRLDLQLLGEEDGEKGET